LYGYGIRRHRHVRRVAAALQVQEILVTAQKRAENPQDSPISIQAFRAEAIEILGSKSSSMNPPGGRHSRGAQR
jgi:hypothetical protein